MQHWIWLLQHFLYLLADGIKKSTNFTYVSKGFFSFFLSRSAKKWDIEKKSFLFVIVALVMVATYL